MPKSYLRLAVTDGGLEIEHILLRRQLFGIDLANLALELVDLLDLAAYGRLEDILQLRGLVADVGLQRLGRVFETADLVFYHLLQTIKVSPVFIDRVTQKSAHMLHLSRNTSSLQMCSVRFMSTRVCSFTSNRMESSILGSLRELFWKEFILLL